MRTFRVATASVLVFAVVLALVFSSRPQIALFNFSPALEVALAADPNPYVGFFSPERLWTAAGDANLNLRQPDPRNGDLLVAVIAIRPSASTINTPTGWTSLGSYIGTDGLAEGVDTGSVRIHWFYKVANGTEGTANLTFTENGTTSVWIGSIMKVRSSTRTYALSLGGYSINGDTTNWNGTLDTNIGLTAGDLVLIAAAQNGNLGAASAQNITATGITAKSTVYEHGEYSSTTGNDVEIALASTLIWAGTNSATPTITQTISPAASGAVTALRIRQGPGTNRTDSWVRSAGVQVAGSTSVSVPYPEHNVGDLLILFVGNRDSTATPSTPAGWTLLANNYTGGSGTFTADSGNARISAYFREATSQFTGVQSVTITGGNTAIGQMVSIRKDEVANWVLDQGGGADNTPGTSWSVTGSAINLSSAHGGDIVLVASSINTDARLYSAHSLSASGITFGDVTQTAEFRSSTGNDMTLELVTGRVTGGSGTVAPTFNSTANGSATTNPAGASMFVKIVGLVPSFEQSAYRFFNNADSTDVGTALAAQNTAATLGSTGAQFRLRLLIHVGTANLALNGATFKLQFAQQSGTCDTGFVGETYADVTAATVIAYHNNPTPVDGAALTANANDPTHGASVIVNQSYEEANNFTNNIAAISVGQNGKWDFSLRDNGAAASTTYCLRVVRATGATLNTYTVIPQITTAAPPGQSITFSISDNSIGFGTLASGAARWATGDTLGSSSEVIAHTIDAATNATSGYTITVEGATLTSGANTITAIGAVNAPSTPGSEQYGLRITASGGTGSVSAPYNHASNYAYGATATIPHAIASATTGDNVTTIYSIRYLSNISALTEPGNYTATMTYIITANF